MCPSRKVVVGTLSKRVRKGWEWTGRFVLATELCVSNLCVSNLHVTERERETERENSKTNLRQNSEDQGKVSWVLSNEKIPTTTKEDPLSKTVET